jgi:uncharacterized repeat protein (TIGR02543 family)
VSDTGYHFVGWSDGSTDNPRTDTNVTIDLAVTANFAIDTFTLDYAAGTGGSLSGDLAQIVEYGQSGTPVTAVSDANYHFVNWSDGSTSNPRSDTNVTTNVAVTANFAEVVYNLTIDVNSVEGGTTDPPMGVHTYAAGTEITLTATANPGWIFAGWSGDLTSNENSITITITNNQTIIANFKYQIFVPIVAR